MMNVRIADLKDFEKIMKIYKYAPEILHNGDIFIRMKN